MKKFFFRVDKGDSLCSVSERFDIPVVKIIKDNRLSREIEEGDMLYLEKDEGYKVYTVLPTDTVEKIAAANNTSAERILQENGIPYVYFSQKILLSEKMT